MRRLAVVLAVLLAVGLVMAQAPKAPKPGPDHKRLGYFVGKWTNEGDMKASPFGPAGKFTATETWEWYTGGFAIVGNSMGTMAGLGEMKGMSMMAYNPETKVYSYSAINSMGETDYSTGTVKGKVWNWTGDSKKGGKSIKGTFTITEVSPTSYTYKYDASIDGGPMQTIMTGKCTKSK